MTPGPRACVVEDDHVWQGILREILEEIGLQVDVADSLKGALALLRSRPYRLVIADLALNESDHSNQEGVQVLDAVRALRPECITILLTGYADVELAVSALTEHGALSCLRKETFNRRQLRELVQRGLSAPLAHVQADKHDSSLATRSGREPGEKGNREDADLGALTEREREVLTLLAKGMTNKEIAAALVITNNTVKRHLKAVFEKLDVHTRSAAAARAISAGLGQVAPP